MKTDFNSMNKAELRAYLIAHPDETEAFYAFVDRFTGDASVETFAMAESPADIAQVQQLIQQKISKMKSED